MRQVSEDPLLHEDSHTRTQTRTHTHTHSFPRKLLQNSILLYNDNFSTKHFRHSYCSVFSYNSTFDFPYIP